MSKVVGRRENKVVVGVMGKVGLDILSKCQVEGVVGVYTVLP